MAKALYGLLGFPVKHSFSPAMHNAAFKESGIDSEYRLFEVKPFELKKFLFEPEAVFSDNANRQVKSFDVAGFNITIPHKVAAKEMLEARFSADQSDGQYFVRLAGALNTARRDQNCIQYRNTDVPGFLASLREDLHFDCKGKTVLLLGCGGAGRAVIAGLTSPEGSVKKIYVHENDELTVRAARNHFESLASTVYFIGKDSLESAAADAQLLVNATPVGMRVDDLAPIDRNFLHKNLYVYDVVYNKETQLVRDAREKAANVSGGLGMLLYQGVIAWEFWTGKNAPVPVMRDALINALAEVK
jgi:shikimate dehydrogenase